MYIKSIRMIPEYKRPHLLWLSASTFMLSAFFIDIFYKMDMLNRYILEMLVK